MNFASVPQPLNFPHITLVITPYHIKGPSTWTYPEPLLNLLRDIVSQHSILSTAYQSAFYQDLNNPSRFYHLQTSPSEPPTGWLTNLTSTNTTSPSSHDSSSTSVSPKKPTLADHLSLLNTHATLHSSNGLIRLGLTLHKHPYYHHLPLFTTTIAVPFNAPLLLIGTRDIASTPDVRVKVENEMRDQLRFFRRFTGAFKVAAGWRHRGYAPAYTRINPDTKSDAGSGSESGVGGVGTAGDTAKEQFVTLSGWKAVEDYTTFKKLMVMEARSGQWGGDLGVGRVSPDVAGEKEIWARRIA